MVDTLDTCDQSQLSCQVESLPWTMKLAPRFINLQDRLIMYPKIELLKPIDQLFNLASRRFFIVLYNSSGMPLHSLSSKCFNNPSL